MKICVISPGVVHAVPRTLAFAKYFEDVHFIDNVGNADKEKLLAAGIHYYYPDEYKYSGISFFNLQKILKHIDPDVIVCHFCAGVHFFGAIAYGRSPVVGIVMGSDVLYHKGDRKVSSLSRLLIRMGLRQTHYITAKSEYLRQRSRQLGATCPISVNYWGADTRQFKPVDKIEMRRKLGLPEKIPIILSPRTLSPLYSIDVIIDAMSQVVSEEPDALLLILGIASAGYKCKLKKQIADNHLDDNIRLIGLIKYEEISKYYNASDIVVSMAKSEGFPNSVLEVLCCARTVLVGRIPQLEEILQDGINCRMIEINRNAIAQSIIDLIQHPKTAARLAEGGYDIAQRFANIRKNGQVFASELKNHLSKLSQVSSLRLAFYRFIFLMYVIQRKLSKF